MATIEQYQSGWLSEAVRQTVRILRQAEGPLTDTALRHRLETQLSELQPRVLTLDEAIELINGSRVQAVGHRMCSRASPKTPGTSAIFLDELAEALVAVGRATLTDSSTATQVLAKQSDRRTLVATRVEGREQELCCTVPVRCFYWNLERRHQRCLAGRDPRVTHSSKSP